MDLEDADLDQADERRQRVDDQIFPDLALFLDLHPSQALRRPVADMFLVEARLVRALGATHERRRAVLEVREDPLRDRFVEPSQVELGGAVRGIEDSIGVCQPHAGNNGFGGGFRRPSGPGRTRDALHLALLSRVVLRGRGALADHRVGGLVFPETLKCGVPKLAVAGPLAEAHLGHELGLHPMRARGAGGARGERARLLLEARQALLEIAEHPVVESGPDLADVHETPALVDAAEQRADADPRAFGLGVATDHDLLLLETLDLEPLWAARAAVRRVAFLRHDAFQAELARVREEVGARTDDVIAVAQHRGPVVGRGEQPRERRLAVFQARAGEVPTVEV